MTWKKIRGFDNYSVNERGDVRNDTTGKLKTPFVNKANGYKTFDLWSDNKPTKATAHRLVAEAFIPNPDGKPTVDHIDGDRQNNDVSNLRWATYSEQNSRFGTVGVRSSQVLVLHYAEERKKRGGGHVRWLGVDSAMIFDSITAAAEHFGVTIGNISMMLEHGKVGRRGKMRGYRFKYLNGSRAVHKDV